VTPLLILPESRRLVDEHSVYFWWNHSIPPELQLTLRLADLIICRFMRNNEHAALIRIPLSDDDLGTADDDALVDCVEVAVCAALDREPRAGKWDGHEFGGGWAVIFCYGQDPAALFERVTEALLPFELPTAATLALETNRPEGLEIMTVISVGVVAGADA
jgi:hypothetical protein